jgi:hypothetical protein
LRGKISLGAALLGQPLLPGRLDGASDQPVLRLDRVELAAGTFGVVGGALGRQLERLEPGGVMSFGFGQRLGGRRQRGGREDSEHLVADALLEPSPSDALTGAGGAIQALRGETWGAPSDARGSGSVPVHAAVQ